MANEKREYMLCCELHGHSKDVRAVAAGRSTPEGGQSIYSGSRDKSLKIWQPLNDAKNYHSTLTLEDHKNFVSCVYYHKPMDWICSGSNDNTVCVYAGDGHLPFVRLTQHTDTVTAICGGLSASSIVTGSWDKSAIIWSIDGAEASASLVLRGHEAAVWSVTVRVSRKEYVTGGADKKIIVWSNAGGKLQQLDGHTDCVRGLLVLSNDELLSVGNDAVVRRWSVQGVAKGQMLGHSNYIYGCAQHEPSGTIATCSEDSTVRVYNAETGMAVAPPIKHPAISVWSVACLANGDIVTGASDGIVRVFTCDVQRAASEPARKAFLLAVDQLESQRSEEIGGVKKSDLPGPEALYKQGTREGQHLMIRDTDNSVKCYSWQSGSWQLLGDVMGASGGTAATSGKELYEGKEYDFVFNVDIQDGAPTIKLPYNLSEDAYEAAQRFIHKNQLPQDYLSQVADFITKNSQHRRLQGASSSSGSNESYYDPFTGSSRYVPGTSNGGNNYQSGGNADPFTGSASYSTTKQASQHYPVREYTTLSAYDGAKILEKIKAFNQTLVGKAEYVPEEHLATLLTLAEAEPLANPTALLLLNQCLQWPSELLFPVIDVLRLAVRSESLCVRFNTSHNFMDLLVAQLSSCAPNQLMSVRCFGNMLAHEGGRQLVSAILSNIVGQLGAIRSGSNNMQLSIACFYLNASVWQLTVADADTCALLTQGIGQFLDWAIETEACYCSLQAIGNLLTTKHKAAICAQAVSAESVVARMRKLSAEQSGKLSELGDQLMTAIQNSL